MPASTVVVGGVPLVLRAQRDALADAILQLHCETWHQVLALAGEGEAYRGIVALGTLPWALEVQRAVAAAVVAQRLGQA
jgi:hypothetical protein